MGEVIILWYLTLGPTASRPPVVIETFSVAQDCTAVRDDLRKAWGSYAKDLECSAVPRRVGRDTPMLRNKQHTQGFL